MKIATDIRALGTMLEASCCRPQATKLPPPSLQLNSFLPLNYIFGKVLGGVLVLVLPARQPESQHACPEVHLLFVL